MAQVTSGDVSIVYDDLGQGEPALLLLPGWCANRTVFQSLAPFCGGRRRTLALDWRGHGESGSPAGDFGVDDLVEDALNVIEASGAQSIVPVALSHAGWVAIELHRRLGVRVEKLVLLDWIIMMQPPREFFDTLDGMQSSERWRETVERIFSVWLGDVDPSTRTPAMAGGDSLGVPPQNRGVVLSERGSTGSPPRGISRGSESKDDESGAPGLPGGLHNAALVRFVREEMGAYGFEMWARAAREISTAYADMGTPLQTLAAMNPPPPVLHLYAQPDEPRYLASQQSFAAKHSWFKVMRLNARSHFPMFEVPEEMADAIEQFVNKDARDFSS